MTARDITALVLVREGDRSDTLARTLDAVAAQERRPDRVLAIRWPRADGDHLEELDGVVDVPAGSTLSAAVRLALRSVPEPVDVEAPASWLWFVPADSAPGHGVLRLEEAAAEADELAAVVGATRRRERETSDRAEGSHRDPVRTADDADGLVDVGITLTHSARIVSGVEEGEIDQGQLDWRGDVLAVPLAGLLVREDLYRVTGGLDPALTSPWAEIGLCHRIWRRGARVAVVPAARVLAPQPDADPVRAARANRRGQILTRLSLVAWPLALLLILISPLASLGRMVASVVTHRPRGVIDEAVAWAGAMRRAPALLRRTSRAAGRARTPRRRLAPLFLSRRETLRRRLQDAWTATFADDERSRRIRRTTWGIAGTSHGTRDADYGRHSAWTVAVAIVSVVLAGVSLRRLLSGGDLVAPDLVPLPASWRTTWQAAWSDWVPAGLGARGQADPLTRLLGHVPLSGSAVTDVILLGAIPLAALTAWWAAGALTRAVGARLVLAAAWALAPALLTSLSEGRWPVLIAHVLLPVLALCVGRAVGLAHKVSQASVSAAAAGGLVLLVIGAVQPVLVLVVALALALVAIAVPGRRLRLLWVLIPSVALHLPYLGIYADAPRTLLAIGGQSGAPASPTTVAGLLALWPGAAPHWGFLAPWIGATGAALVPLLILAPVALAALVSPFLAGAAGYAGRLALVVLGVSLALAVACGHVLVGVDGTSAVTAPAHALLSVATLALLLAAGCTFDALARRDEGTGRTRRTLSTVAAAVVALVTVVAVAGWTIALPASLTLARGQAPGIPAAAADQGTSDARLRTLVLTRDADAPEGTPVDVSLVVDGGDSIVQRASVVSARDAEGAHGTGLDTDPGSRALLESGSQLVAGTDAGADTLRALSVGYVVVPGADSADPALAAALDRSPLLEKVTQNADGGMWRVLDTRPRAAVITADTGADGGVLVPSELIRADGELAADPAPRVLALSERREGDWRAEIGGHVLRPVTLDGWAQGFEVPAGVGGEVVIHRDTGAMPVAQLVLAAALFLTVLVAVPWRGRAIRTQERRRVVREAPSTGGETP